MEKNRVKNTISLKDALRERQNLLDEEREILIKIANTLLSNKIDEGEKKWSWSLSLSMLNEISVKDITEDMLTEQGLMNVSEMLQNSLGENFIGYMTRGISIPAYMKIIEILLKDIEQEKRKISKILKL